MTVQVEGVRCFRKEFKVMSKLRIGLIGYGSWARNAYLPALRHSGRANILSVAAPSERTRQLIRNELGNDLLVFDGFEALLNGPQLDGVMIAVPDFMHEAALTAALAAGVAVFYEPPLSHKRQHILPMLSRLLAAHQITHADLELGYIPAVKRVAELVQTQVLGQIQTVGLRLQASWQAEPHYDLSTIGRLAPWYVDVLNRILGATPLRAFVLDGHGNDGRAQNYGLAHFDYGEAWASFHVNIASVGELAISIDGHGTAGDFALDLFTGEIRFRSRRNSDWTIEQWPAQTPYADWPGMHESVAAFLDAIEKGESSSSSALKMAQLNLVALAAEEAKDSDTWARVKDVASIENIKTVVEPPV
jgi:predicted dehydrogenase